MSILVVTPTTSPQSAETETLIDSLRRDVIPSAVSGTTLRVYVGGQTAIFQDFAGVLAGKLPLFILVVVLLGCLLLMLAFRSIVIPLTAAAMNLLAAGAAVGVVVAVFQWGWGSETLGLGKPGPIEAFLPVMLVAILFGLSMDYQVFLVSRMHEEWVRTGRQRPRGPYGSGGDRPGHHGRGSDHGRRLPCLRTRRAKADRGVRSRSRDRDPARRCALAHDPGARFDAAPGSRQLVAALVAGPIAPPDRR